MLKLLASRTAVFLSIWTFLSLCLFFVLGVMYFQKAEHPKVIANAAVSCTTDSGKLLGYINSERSVKGAPALTIDSSVVSASRAKLNDMTTNRYFGHYKLDGTNEQSFFIDNGVRAAWSSDIEINSLSPESSWNGFKNSPSHYASLTDPKYTRVGIAEQCGDVNLEHVTGPADNSKFLNTKATEFTVIYLAAAEPTPQPRVQTQYVPAPATPHITNCYENYYGNSLSCYSY